ncbi:tripartite tricarboxylate transporter substrate binding protein [Piscinibacter sakaiensis]|uniref:tripartite tricarboxylate transporter substrate binding protein n=1 Tax=Piscinibacter sakaiensis TaxID=1547922 RepID=UPI003AAC1864
MSGPPILLRPMKALAAALAIAAAPLAANAWTDKPVRILVPAPAGGTADIVARVVADAVSAEIGQPVIVENKPGAGGAIAVQALRSAPADGQTLLIAASNILTEVPLVMKTSFDPVKDVKPVTMVGRANLVLVAGAHARDLKGLIGHLKSHNGGQGSFASYTAGTSSHYAGLIFSKKARLDLTHIPYPGSPPALQNLMGGQVDIMFDGMPTALPLVKAGKLVAYGVTAKTRSVHLPNVPTMAEQGFAEIEFSNWLGTIVSSELPADLMSRINIATVKAVMTPKVRDRLVAAGFEPAVSDSPDKLAQSVKADYKRNAQIVKTFGITLNQ